MRNKDLFPDILKLVCVTKKKANLKLRRCRFTIISVEYAVITIGHREGTLMSIRI